VREIISKCVCGWRLRLNSGSVGKYKQRLEDGAGNMVRKQGVLVTGN